MRIAEWLKTRGEPARTIPMACSVAEAAGHMAAKGIRALVVVNKRKPVGIFTRQDLWRCHFRFSGKPLEQIPVADVMTPAVVSAAPGERIEAAVAAMIAADIRHLPIIDEHQIVGMLTLSSLVGDHINRLNLELNHLREYITDMQEARED